MRQPVLLIIANVAIVLTVVGSFAHSLLSEPKGSPQPSISQTHPSYTPELSIDPQKAPSTGAPLLSVDVTPGKEAKSFIVTGQTEVGNTVTVNGVPTVVLTNGTFNMTLRNCSASCVVKVTNPQGVSSEVTKPLPPTVSVQATSQQYVTYGTR